MELKKNMEIPGGWGGPPTTLWNGNSRGVGGFKLKNHPWGGMDIFWNHTMEGKSSWDTCKNHPKNHQRII